MEMLRETFFMKGFITAMVIAVLTKVIVWANYHILLVSSEEMERPKRYWIGTLKKKIENYYNLQTKVNNISCIVDKYFEKVPKCGWGKKIKDKIVKVLNIG